MTKSDLINFLVATYGYKLSAAKIIVEAIFNRIRNELLAGNSVQLADFGTFSIKARAARKGRNPRTGEEIQIPEMKRVHFAAVPLFKKALQS